MCKQQKKYDIFGISEAFNHALEWRSRGADGMIRRDVSPALRATDYKCPKYVWYKSNETNMNEDKNQERKIVEPFVVASRGREPQCLAPKRTEYGKAIRKQYEAHEVTEQRKNIQKLEPRTDGITNTLTSVQKDNLLCEPICLNSKVNGKQPSLQDRIYSPEGTSTAITTCFHVNIQEPINAMPNFRIRKLTPRECFRIMDVDEADIDKIQAAGISDSQQYKLAGNSIVVNVLTEIFRKLLVDTQTDDGQMRMF